MHSFFHQYGKCGDQVNTKRMINKLHCPFVTNKIELQAQFFNALVGHNFWSSSFIYACAHNKIEKASNNLHATHF